jgi:radical SAM superfamily enzyme YgiQ (UPF0313 family)
MLRDRGFDVKIMDANVLPDESEIFNFITADQPEVVVISCFAHNYSHACKISQIAKELGCLGIMSGFHATFISKRLLRENPFVDIVVRGEEEMTMVELMEALSDGNKIDHVKGITYRVSEKIIRVNADRELMDINSVPIPALDLLPLNKYERIPVLASRGCFNKCIYCPYSAFWRYVYRVRDPQSVINEIEYVTQKFKIRRIEFLDNLFDFSTWGIKLFQLMKKEGININWTCSTRPDMVNEESLKMAKDVGCEEITFGIETVSNEIQQKIGKFLNMEQAKSIVKAAGKYGIKRKLNFIIGLPDQTEKEIVKCINFAKETRPEKVSVNILTPYPGTEITENAEKYGIKYNHKDWWKFGETNFIIESNRLSYEKINSLFSKFIKELSDLGISYTDGY